MTRLGRNLKIDVSPSQRDAARRFYEEGLSLSRRSPRESLDLFDFEDGACLALFYSDAVTDPSQCSLGVWLEFEVDDPNGTAERLVSLGGTTVKGATDHPYVKAPAGPIFRLAPRT